MECEQRTPLTMVSMYLREVSHEKRAEYDRWVKAGRPKLTDWYGEPEDIDHAATKDLSDENLTIEGHRARDRRMP